MMHHANDAWPLTKAAHVAQTMQSAPDPRTIQISSREILVSSSRNARRRSTMR